MRLHGWKFGVTLFHAVVQVTLSSVHACFLIGKVGGFHAP